MKGKKSGDIKAVETTNKGREGQLMVYAWDTDASIPVDSLSGLTTGRRKHVPVTLVIRMDSSYPLLFNAFATNEILTGVKINVWQPSASSVGQATELTMVVSLTNAQITRITHIDSFNEARCPGSQHCVRLSLIFQKIEYAWTKGGIVAVDDWAAAF